jgi:hypothetical protein
MQQVEVALTLGLGQGELLGAHRPPQVLETVFPPAKDMFESNDYDVRSGLAVLGV